LTDIMPRELPLVARFKAHDWQCSSVDFHPAGNMIASASWDRTIKIWDVEEQTLLRTIDREGGHTRPITSVKWHPNGALIATTSAGMCSGWEVALPLLMA
jgi:WD40 repeat protein